MSKRKKENGNKITSLEVGKIGLIQQQEDGSIKQIGLSTGQSRMLQSLLGIMSQGEPLVLMGEDYELVLRTKLKRILTEIMSKYEECICSNGLRFNGITTGEIINIFENHGISFDPPF